MSPVETDPTLSSSTEVSRLPPGMAVGEYRLETLLGEGGMGSVYGAIQPEIGARVAIKVLGRDLSRDPRLVKRFVDEARAVNKIGHPNIIDIFAFGRLDDGRQYFVMELLEGETLAARLARGPLPVSEARRLLLQACEALEAAHAAGIIHRDLKPENLWIATPKHGQPYLKILDFGIAKLVDERDATAGTELGLAMGTPHYMSPEQCRGEPVDHRTDIYAMGVLLYFMWSGRLPFDGGNILAVVSQQVTTTPAPPSTYRPVAPALERLILRCLEKDPAQRPQSARALGEALGAALGDLLPGETLPPASAPATGTRPTTLDKPTASRGARRLAVIGLCLLALALGAAIMMLGGSRPAPSPPPSVTRTEAPAGMAAATTPVTAPPPAATEAPGTPPARVAKPVTTRDHRPHTAPATPQPASHLDERGFIRDNPFR